MLLDYRHKLLIVVKIERSFDINRFNKDICFVDLSSYLFDSEGFRQYLVRDKNI